MREEADLEKGASLVEGLMHLGLEAWTPGRKDAAMRGGWRLTTEVVQGLPLPGSRWPRPMAGSPGQCWLMAIL